MQLNIVVNIYSRVWNRNREEVEKTTIVSEPGGCNKWGGVKC